MTASFRGFLLVLLFAVGGCATAPVPSGYVPTANEKQLVVLIEKRLAYAFDVAWFKYQRNLPIYDPQREASSLQSLILQGQSLHVPASTVMNFFSAQMTASREFQAEVMDGWRRGTALPRYAQVDLEKEIRPKLDEINREMLVLLASPEVHKTAALADYAYQFMRAREYSPNVANAATAPLGR